jgi:hypothetical protein
MFPWTHAAFGYLLLVVGTVLLRRTVSRAELVAVIAGTQFADVVDKPLAWTVTVLPSGRSLAHSLLFAVPLCLLVLAVAWHRSHPEVGTAFGLGYASHLLGDTYTAIRYWNPQEFGFLLYPLLPPHPEKFGSFGAFLDQLTVTSDFMMALVAAAALGTLFLVQFARAPPWANARTE